MNCSTIGQLSCQIVKEQCWISRPSEGQGHDATCQWKGHDLLAKMCVSMK